MKIFTIIYSSIILTVFHNLFEKKPLDESIADGKELYNDFCSQCHLTDGKGVKGVYPPLANSDFLLDVEKTINSIKYGLKGPIIVNGEKYNSIMISQGLDDEEISDVVNYILNSWGNTSANIVTEEMVSAVR